MGVQNFDPTILLLLYGHHLGVNKIEPENGLVRSLGNVETWIEVELYGLLSELRHAKRNGRNVAIIEIMTLHRPVYRMTVLAIGE